MTKEYLTIGNAGRDLIENSDDPIGRGHEGEWFVDVYELAKQVYQGIQMENLIAEINSVDSPPDRDKERIKAAAEEVDDGVFIEEFCTSLTTSVLEEVMHAQDSYFHPIICEVEHGSTTSREKVEDVLSSYLDGYRESSDPFHKDRISFVIEDENIERKIKKIDQEFEEKDIEARFMKGISSGLFEELASTSDQDKPGLEEFYEIQKKLRESSKDLGRD